MNQIYKITGMTCEGCQKSVQEKLQSIPGVNAVDVNLEKGEAHVSMDTYIPIATLQQALSKKYTISELFKHHKDILDNDSLKASKFQQLKPLFLIFAYLLVSAVLMHFKNWNLDQAMLDFMGLFYIVFSFFKLLDLKGFPKSFEMYDPLAKAFPFYGLIYPFIELGLGVLFLMRIQIGIALIATVVILGITTFGVVKTLLNKRSIRCACLGTTLNLPMTEATFIENTLMIVMAMSMLIKML